MPKTAAQRLDAIERFLGFPVEVVEATPVAPAVEPVVPVVPDVAADKPAE